MMRDSGDHGGATAQELGRRHVVVVGGGLGGLAAATVLAERGVRVTLLEREAYLGGRAGAWGDTLADGTPFEMERGFHGFFRQYYNLRALIRRVDPGLERLVRLRDYPILGPGGARECFTDLPRTTPLNLVELIRRTPHLRMSDLPRIPLGRVSQMLAFDPEATYRRWDGVSATAYLDSLRFPPRARRMLFDVFSHSFFNPEDDFSAAELLMQFHFYFVGNPEGLVFDVMDEPFSLSLFEPLRRYLERLGVRFALDTEVTGVERDPAGRFRITTAAGETHEGDGCVLAVTVPALKRLVAASPSLDVGRFRADVDTLDVTLPFAVWRLWLDRKPDAGREPFVGTAGLGHLDNVSLYETFEGESRRWSLRTGGSVVELHAYAVPQDATEQGLRTELLETLHHLYPELRDARILEDRFLLRQDCPSFAPGSHATRPTPATPIRGLTLAGDFVKLPYPSALMERATSAGFEAANGLLADWGGRPEPIRSIPTRGLLARGPLRGRVAATA